MIKHTRVAGSPSIRSQACPHWEPRPNTNSCLLGTVKCSFSRLKGAQGPGQKDRSRERAAKS